MHGESLPTRTPKRRMPRDKIDAALPAGRFTVGDEDAAGPIVSHWTSVYRHFVGLRHGRLMKHNQHRRPRTGSCAMILRVG